MGSIGVPKTDRVGNNARQDSLVNMVKTRDAAENARRQSIIMDSADVAKNTPSRKYTGKELILVNIRNQKDVD